MHRLVAGIVRRKHTHTPNLKKIVVWAVDYCFIDDENSKMYLPGYNGELDMFWDDIFERCVSPSESRDSGIELEHRHLDDVGSRQWPFGCKSDESVGFVV